MADTKIVGDTIRMITDEHLVLLADMIADRVIRSTAETNHETCTKSRAAEIIGVTRLTVHNMIRDGRLKATADGKRVVSESVNRYITSTGGQDGVEKRRARARNKKYV